MGEWHLKILLFVSDVKTCKWDKRYEVDVGSQAGLSSHTVLFHMRMSNTNMRHIECFAKIAVENHTCDMAISLRIAQEEEMN